MELTFPFRLVCLFSLLVESKYFIFSLCTRRPSKANTTERSFMAKKDQKKGINFSCENGDESKRIPVDDCNPLFEFLFCGAFEFFFFFW